MSRASIYVWKVGALVKADVPGAKFFEPVGTGLPIDPARVIAIDTETLPDGHGQIKTVLATIGFHGSATAVEAWHGDGVLERVFDVLFQRDGFPYGPVRASQITQRSKAAKTRRTGKSSGRDGDRITIPPILCVFFNMEYDLGRLFADRATALRSLASGAEAYQIPLDGYTLEVRRMIRGMAPRFEWRVHCQATRKVLRILGMDLAAYWKTSLAKAADAVGAPPKLDIESAIPDVFERPIGSLSDQERRLLKEYALGDSATTLELYHRTVGMLCTLDPRIVKKTGQVPPSGPAAAARMTFARVFDKHKVPKWRRPPLWAEQMGALASAAGRSFSRPGIYQGVHILDLKSAYVHQVALLPDPVTLQCHPIPTGPFDWRQYRGKYGAVLISGTSLNAVYPALRIHDSLRQGRLRYVFGKFDAVWTTLPEVVIGIARGALKDVVVHRGVVMDGDPSTSFLRSAMIDFYAIKEGTKNPAAVQSFGKSLSVSVIGKLLEVHSDDYLVPETFTVPRFFAEESIAATITQLYADRGETERVSYWGATDAIGDIAVDYYVSVFDPNDPDPGEAAVEAYIGALVHAGEPFHPGAAMSLRHFLLRNRKYRCGHFYMPLYSAQVTGATSALLGAMAECLDALQGDTDSVHFQLPDGVRSVEESAGFQRYFALMDRAGYPAPRRMPDGSIVNGIPEVPTLGLWDLKTSTPSAESILVRPKVYSHLFEGEHGLEFVQARHGFTNFDDAEARWARRHGEGSAGEREATAKSVLQEQLHEAIRELLVQGKTTYKTRGRPRSLREAALSKKEVGEFLQTMQTLVSTQDPATTVGDDGIVRWLPLTQDERLALRNIATPFSRIGSTMQDDE